MAPGIPPCSPMFIFWSVHSCSCSTAFTQVHVLQKSLIFSHVPSFSLMFLYFLLCFLYYFFLWSFIWISQECPMFLHVRLYVLCSLDSLMALSCSLMNLFGFLFCSVFLCVRVCSWFLIVPLVLLYMLVFSFAPSFSLISLRISRMPWCSLMFPVFSYDSKFVYVPFVYSLFHCIIIQCLFHVLRVSHPSPHVL